MYTKLLIEALQKYESNHSYYFFTQHHSNGAGFTRGQKIPNDVELIHYPYFDPYFITLPFSHHKPTIVTVHDLIPLVFPEHFPAGVRGALRWQYQRMRLAKAKRIIADSEASKEDIEHIAGIPGSRIDVVRLAPSNQYRPMTNDSLVSRVKAKFDLPEAFILYVGDVNWNKNVIGMLKAYQGVKRQASSVKLVLVGRAFLDHSLKEMKEINSFIDEAKLTEDVVRLGSVPLEDLVVVYNLASVYLQPSFYEGFGLPVLEAFVCGVPVVSSRAASLAEIAGPAIPIDPADPADMNRGLMTALTMTTTARRLLIKKQTAWVGQFSWERVARQTIQSYEKALA